MMILLTGPMASGKSTVAELLAQKFSRSVHLRGDIFRKMILQGREEMSETPSEEALHQLNLRYQITAEAAKLYHKAGFTVIIQDNYYGEKLTYMLDLLEPLEVHTFVLCPSVDTLRRREELRGKKGYMGFTVEDLYKTFIRETPPLGYWLDNSKQSPEESAEEIFLHLSLK